MGSLPFAMILAVPGPSDKRNKDDYAASSCDPATPPNTYSTLCTFLFLIPIVEIENGARFYSLPQQGMLSWLFGWNVARFSTLER